MRSSSAITQDERIPRSEIDKPVLEPRERKKAEINLSLGNLVAPTGFEPATSALRGRRPKPLDDGAI